MSTHIFKLISGVECEVKPFIGKHQRILTEKKGGNITDALNEVLRDVIVRIGTEQNITPDLIKSLLSNDRKKILVETRQFSMDFEPKFEFNYDYKDSKGAKIQLEQEIDLSEGFNEVPLKVPSKNDNGSMVILEAPYKEYSEIQRRFDLILPKSGKKISIGLLDGTGESIGINTPKNKRSSHTAIMMRIPKEYSTTKSGEPIEIQLDLDNLPIKDIEYIRASIKEMEGSIDTEYMFEHPDADNMPQGQKEIVVDLVSTLAFFFPSEAI